MYHASHHYSHFFLERLVPIQLRGENGDTPFEIIDNSDCNPGLVNAYLGSRFAVDTRAGLSYRVI